MKLFRLKYWDTEPSDELQFINIDAITCIDIYTYNKEYFLKIGLGDTSLTYEYIHQLNRDKDINALVEACNA